MSTPECRAHETTRVEAAPARVVPLHADPNPWQGWETGGPAVEKPDLLILGMDRQALEIGLAVATLGGKVVVAPGENAVSQAIRDGEMLTRLASATDAADFERRRCAAIEDIRRQRSPERLRAARIRVETGPAAFVDRRRVAVGETIFQPRRILIATGSRFSAPRDGFHALFEQGEIPRRIILRGNSAMALDAASLLLRLGAQVTLVSEAPLAPEFDPDGLRLLLDDLEKRGLLRLTALPPARPADVPCWEIGASIPDLDGLGIEKAGLKLRDGRLVLKNGFETSQSRIFAIGAVAQPDQPADPGAVAHLIGRMFFRRSGRFTPAPLVRVTGGVPALASLGLSQREAVSRSGIRIARASFAEADPTDSSGGFVTLLADPKGRLLGASLYGESAGERIVPLALALAQGLTLAEIARLPFPAGTASEAIRLAAASPARNLLRAPKIQRAFRFFRFFG